MRLDRAVNSEDLHQMAKPRLPKVAFDLMEGGLEDEHGLDRNTAAFRKHQLLPRYLADAALDAMVLTVDVPVSSKRERNIRNRFANIHGNWYMAAMSLKLPILTEALSHPGWVLEYVRNGGTPMVENWQPYAPTDSTPSDVLAFNRTQMPHSAQTWRDFERYRKLFPRKVVIKGI